MTKIGCVHRVPLFNNLACDERSEVQELLYHKTFQKGEIIFSPADPEHLSIVSAGAMKMYKLSKTGKEQLIRRELSLWSLKWFSLWRGNQRNKSMYPI